MHHLRDAQGGGPAGRTAAPRPVRDGSHGRRHPRIRRHRGRVAEAERINAQHVVGEHGHHRSLQPSLLPELLQDARGMRFHRALGDTQFPCQLPITQTCTQQEKHFPLPPRQLLQPPRLTYRGNPGTAVGTRRICLIGPPGHSWPFLIPLFPAEPRALGAAAITAQPTRRY
ncbi:hypothetical protein STAN_3236 [Streptomyces sp. CBMAI 2042]|nr:hypothetical protein STAN_3236 [Streptomyces sp. CBMAI 2042]